MLKSSLLDTLEVLDTIEHALDAVNHGQREWIEHEHRMLLVTRARRVLGRLEGLAAVLLREAEMHGSAERTRHTPLTSVIALDEGLDSGHVAGQVFAARAIARHGQVADAVLTGAVSPSHAKGIAKGMGQLHGLDAGQSSAAQAAFLRLATTCTPRELPGKAAEVLAEVAPELVPDDARKERQLDEQRRRAIAARHLRFWEDDDGSIGFKGSLPTLEGTTLMNLINTQVESSRRAARDGTRERSGADSAGELTPAQRRADALLAILDRHGRTGSGKTALGERPRIVITMTLQDLREGIRRAGVLPSGAEVSPGQLRQLLCDADLMPVVLGTDSEILDVGRTERLVTPAIRRSLSVRDKGCVFPRCDKPDQECEAHHVVPWWAGGSTSLGNLALLCPHHHALIEPDRPDQSGRPKWTIGFNPRTRRPILHPPQRGNSPPSLAPPQPPPG